MQTEFVTSRFPEGTMPRTSTRQAMLRRTRRFILAYAETPRRLSRIREAGSDFGPWKSPADVIDQVSRRTAVMGVGPKLIIQRERDREQLSIREVLAELVVPDLGANPILELLSAEVVAEFGMGLLRDGGLYVCRYIDGTLEVSRHGFRTNEWKGSARDWFVKSGGMPKLTEVAKFMISRVKVHDVDDAHVIYDDRIYTHPSGETAYGGARHYHAHEDCPGGWACK